VIFKRKFFPVIPGSQVLSVRFHCKEIPVRRNIIIIKVANAFYELSKCLNLFPNLIKVLDLNLNFNFDVS